MSVLRKLRNVEVLSLSVNNITTLADVQDCKNLQVTNLFLWVSGGFLLFFKLSPRNYILNCTEQKNDHLLDHGLFVHLSTYM